MITRYVNTASTTGGDGTTNSTVGANRAFATLSSAISWLSGNNQSDDVEFLLCGTTAEYDLLGLYVFFTAPGHTFYIKGNRNDSTGFHNGVWNESCYRIGASTVHAQTIGITSNFDYTVVIDGIQFTCMASGATSECSIYQASTTPLIVKNCLFKQPYIGSSFSCLYQTSAANTVFENCALVHTGLTQIGSEGALTMAGAGTLKVINCIMAGGWAYGITRSNGTVTATNCEVFDNADDFNGTITIDHCASDDGDGTNPITVVSWPAEFNNINYLAEVDFGLNPTSTLLNAGIGPALDVNVPTTDILDFARSGATATVGTFENEWDYSTTTVAPTTLTPTTVVPTTSAPTTVAPTTLSPTTVAPTTLSPTTLAPTTLSPTTVAPTTVVPTTVAPTTLSPTTVAPTTVVPTTAVPTTLSPTTVAPTTAVPTTATPTTASPPTTIAVVIRNSIVVIPGNSLSMYNTSDIRTVNSQLFYRKKSGDGALTDLYLTQSGTADMWNSIVLAYSPSALTCQPSSVSPDIGAIKNSDIFNYSDTGQSFTATDVSNSITVDPILKDLTLASEAWDVDDVAAPADIIDLEQSSDSPVVNTGSDSYVDGATIDIINRTRTFGTHVDMGPFEPEVYQIEFLSNEIRSVFQDKLRLDSVNEKFIPLDDDKEYRDLYDQFVSNPDPDYRTEFCRESKIFIELLELSNAARYYNDKPRKLVATFEAYIDVEHRTIVTYKSPYMFGNMLTNLFSSSQYVFYFDEVAHTLKVYLSYTHDKGLSGSKNIVKNVRFGGNSVM